MARAKAGRFDGYNCGASVFRVTGRFGTGLYNGCANKPRKGLHTCGKHSYLEEEVVQKTAEYNKRLEG